MKKPIMKKPLMSLALAASLMPVMASAVGFIATPIVTGTKIAGKCSSLGMVATPQNISTLSSSVSSGITDMASVLKAGQLEQVAAEKNLLNQQLQALSSSYKSLAAAQSKQQYLDQTTGANLLEDNCTRQSQAPSTAKGLDAAKAFKDKTTKASPLKGQIPISCSGSSCTIQYPTASPSPLDQIAPVSNAEQATKALSTTPPVQWDAATLTSPAASDTDVQATIAHSVVPVPRRGIPDAQLNTTAGLHWNASAQIDRVQTSLAIDTLALVASNHRPTIDSSGAQDLWAQSGLPGNVPNVANGKISPFDFFDSLVQGWYNSPVFSANVKVKDDTWQIKQVAMMMATKLWARQRENELLERAVALQAAELSRRTESDVAAVNQSRDATIDQTIRGQSK
jgi:hypothetical protein